MDAKLPAISVAEHIAARIVSLRASDLPGALRETCDNLLIDVAGLCVTARNEDYIKGTLAGLEDDGPCTAIVITGWPALARASTCASSSSSTASASRR